MGKFIVSAPEAGYEGKVGKVEFHGGKAVIDEDTHPGELAYCRSAGYLVEEDEHAPDTPAVQESQGAHPEGSPVFGSVVLNDLRFDPAEHNADDVLAYLKDADEAEATRVLDAEAAGKERKGITSQRDAILASKQEEK
jgi:hypothetical protein